MLQRFVKFVIRVCQKIRFSCRQDDKSYGRSVRCPSAAFLTSDSDSLPNIDVFDMKQQKSYAFPNLISLKKIKNVFYVSKTQNWKHGQGAVWCQC